MPLELKQKILEFSKRLNQALDLNHIPPKNQGRIQFVAEMFLLSHRGAGKWVNGTSLPPKNKRKNIAKKLNVNYEWLEFGLGEIREEKSNKEPTSVKKLPILSLAEAVNYRKIREAPFSKFSNIDINASNKAFIAYMVGNSMSGKFPEGSMLIIDPAQPVKDGDYVLAKVKRLPEAIIRQIIITEDGKYLFAHDPRYKSHKLTRDDVIIGKIIQTRMDY